MVTWNNYRRAKLAGETNLKLQRIGLIILQYRVEAA